MSAKDMPVKQGINYSNYWGYDSDEEPCLSPVSASGRSSINEGVGRISKAPWNPYSLCPRLGAGLGAGSCSSPMGMT